MADNVLKMLMPNVTSLGYALFLAINAAGVWGGVFPFLPLSFQTREILLLFFLAQSLVFSASYLASAVSVYFLPGFTHALLVKLTSIPYALGWVALIAAIYLHDYASQLVVVGGALLGLGSAGFYMLWQRLFSSQNPDMGVRNLVVGTAFAAVLYFALYLIPQAVTAFLIPLVFLPLFGLCVMVKSREMALDQPMFEDIPRNHPHVYRHIMQDYWRSALGVGVIGFCAGIMRSLAIADPQTGSLVNMLSMAGMFIAAILLLLVWYSRNIHLNVSAIFRLLFPFIITSLLLLPLLPEAYVHWLAAILYAFYSAAIMLMMIQCAQISRDRGVNPVFVYGFFGGIVYALHDIGFIGGNLAEAARVMGISPLALVALVSVYLLGLMYFLGSGGIKRALASNDSSIEFIAMRHTPARKTRPTRDEQASAQRADAPSPASSPSPSPDSAPAAPARAPLDVLAQPTRLHAATPAGASADATYDRIAAQAQLIREHYRLSARETEIMELIARGNTVARIAEMLFVSENTVRTHSKRIYAKLDIHKKQELVDLIDSFAA